MRIATSTKVLTWFATASALAAFGAGAAQAAPTPDTKDDQPSTAQPSASFLAKEKKASQGVVSTPATQAALKQVQHRIASYVANNGTRYTFGSYADPTTGDIVVESSAPAKVVARLTSTSAVQRGGVEVTTRRTVTRDAWHRRDDIPSYYGGAGLSASGALCSSGYAVKNSSGTRYMVTAGHCYANGTSVRTESGANVVGTVFGRALASLGSGPVDMELIGGSSYWGRVYTGGVTSTTSAPVVAAGSAYVGYSNYCHSGRTTGENCGHTAQSTTAQVCTQSGCKSPVIAYTGGTLSAPGDSGGAFYAKDSSGGVWIRGHVIAGSSSTAYAETWNKVASRYGVSIVTG